MPVTYLVCLLGYKFRVCGEQLASSPADEWPDGRQVPKRPVK